MLTTVDPNVCAADGVPATEAVLATVEAKFCEADGVPAIEAVSAMLEKKKLPAVEANGACAKAEIPKVITRVGQLVVPAPVSAFP